MADLFTIGGKQFRQIETSTMEHHIELMRQLRASGLGDCTPGNDETAEQYGLRLLYALIDHGATFGLLGALLIPANLDDAAWTPEVSQQTADFMRRLTSPEDHKLLEKQLIVLVESFFATGLQRSKPSATASVKQAGQPAEDAIAASI